MRALVRSVVPVLGLVVAAWATAQSVPAAPPRTAPAPLPAVATVGALSIPRAELDANVVQALAEYKRRMGQEIPDEFRPMVERQMLENLLRGRLLMLEAQREKLAGSQAEAENELRKDPFFQDNGKFSEAKFQAIKARDPARFNAAVEGIRTRLGAMKLSRQLEVEHAPAEAKLRAQAERDLSSLDLDFLALPYVDYPGTFEEPTEAQVLQRYRTHASEYRRPETVRLTVVFIDRPALPDSLESDPAATKAWDQRLRASADSALAALRAGAPLDSVGAARGGVRRGVDVTRSSFPDFWAGDARADAAVFATAPGGYLPEPVKANPGWMLARVEERLPEHLASLEEVAVQIRRELREDARVHGDEHRLQAMYEAERDSLSGPGLMIRYAAFDTGRVEIPEPTDAELDRFYRGHLADYSSFDPQKGVVVEPGLAAVRSDVTQRWMTERRHETARAAAEGLYRAWSAGKRDPADERLATTLREIGPVPAGAVPDTGLAAAALAESLATRRAERGAGFGGWARGRLVWQVTGVVPRVTPTFEQARPTLAAQLDERRRAADLAGAKALWEKDPQHFAGGRVMIVNRLLVPEPKLLDVPLTRAEVESWYREHISDYSAGEEVHARHILIAPKDNSPEAVEAAHQRALALLARIRAGEDFASLAKQYTDDVATRESGGDLGTFGRGVMLDAFEQAAFAMKPGDVSEPVRTEVGWHIIQCLEHLPPVSEPLSHIYVNVASDRAHLKAEAIALARADSLMGHIHSVAQAVATSRRDGFDILPMRIVLGDPVLQPTEAEYIHTLERMKKGQLYPTVHPIQGLGYGISWVDTILPAPAPSWDQAKDKALAEYRGDAARRTFTAKRAELDSLLRAGWSFDSLGALYGGLQQAPDTQRGGNLRGLGRLSSQADSLLFGTDDTPPVIGPGGITDWLGFRNGGARVRVVKRNTPLAGQVDARVQTLRRNALESALDDYFEGLKKRFPVRILDAKLRELSPHRTEAQGG